MTVAAATSRRWENVALTATGLACAGASAAAFFLHVLGWVRMPFFINFFGMPAIVLMLVLGLYSWNRRLPFARRLGAGLAAGVTGLLAYDSIRYLVYSTHLLDYDPFHALPMLGSLITGRPALTQASLWAGWLYHLWNGFSFAVIYALVAGPARWEWGVAWAMVLEVAMLFAYPSFLAIQASGPFIGVSLIGHSAYGVAIGLTVSRLARTERAA